MTGIDSARALIMRGELDNPLANTPLGQLMQVEALFHACMIDTRGAFELLRGHLNGAPPAGTYYEPPDDDEDA
jgi:hypothetical protein